MMKRNKLLITTIGIGLLFLVINQIVQASSTSGALVLKQAIGARAQGMGEAFTAVADDASSLYWNVAGMGQVADTQIMASYLTGLLDASNGQVMFTKNMGNLGSVGVGLVFAQAGEISLDDSNGDEQTVLAQSDLIGQVAYAMNFNQIFSAGLGLKILDSTLIEQYSAWAIAVDFGMIARLTNELKLGISLRNLGTEIKYIEQGDPLPLTIQVGSSYQLNMAEQHKMLVAIDVVKENDQDMLVHTGAEYWFAKLLAIRAGYKIGYELENFTAGIGVAWQQLQLDYSFGLIQDLNHTHKVSLSVNL